MILDYSDNLPHQSKELQLKKAGGTKAYKALVMILFPTASQGSTNRMTNALTPLLIGLNEEEKKLAIDSLSPYASPSVTPSEGGDLRLWCLVSTVQSL